MAYNTIRVFLKLLMNLITLLTQRHLQMQFFQFKIYLKHCTSKKIFK